MVDSTTPYVLVTAKEKLYWKHTKRVREIHSTSSSKSWNEQDYKIQCESKQKWQNAMLVSSWRAVQTPDLWNNTGSVLTTSSSTGVNGWLIVIQCFLLFLAVWLTSDCMWPMLISHRDSSNARVWCHKCWGTSSLVYFIERFNWFAFALLPSFFSLFAEKRL